MAVTFPHYTVSALTQDFLSFLYMPGKLAFRPSIHPLLLILIRVTEGSTATTLLPFGLEKSSKIAQLLLKPK